MRQFLFFFLCGILYWQAEAQVTSFGGPDTRWNYCVKEADDNDVRSILEVKHIRQYVLDSAICNVLAVETSIQCLENLVDSITLCTKDRKVYHKFQDSIYILYDFDLESGDSMEVKYQYQFDTGINTCDTCGPIVYYIDSTRNINLNGVQVKEQFISLGGQDGFLCNQRLHVPISINDKMGPNNWLFPQLRSPLIRQCRFFGISLFEDRDLYLEDNTYCSLSKNFEINTIPNRTVYWNNESQKLFIRGKKYYRYNIYSISGQLLKSGNFNQEIYLPKLFSGLHFIQIIEFNGQNSSIPFLCQN